VRDDVRRRLDRAIWLDRAKYVGIGLGVVAAIGLAFAYETFDLKVDNKEVPGKVTAIEPLVTKSSTAEAEGENVIVQLDHGPLVRVLAYKSRGHKIGDKIEVVEHHHATGRVTHSLK
jgi:hypothetical protein